MADEQAAAGGATRGKRTARRTKVERAKVAAKAAEAKVVETVVAGAKSRAKAARTVRTGGVKRVSRAATARPDEQGDPGAALPEWGTILEGAQRRFGIKRFRSGQRAVLEAVFAGRDVVGLMPTGAGKSLCYQLPAVFLPKAVVVVSPLIALMQDQQKRAAEASIAVDKVNSTLTAREAREARLDIEGGGAQLIYVTPERLESQEFLGELRAGGGVSLLVVDEAHCIAQWGHDFRPAYLGLGEARAAMGMPPVLALTATATEEVVAEILQVLRAKDAEVVNAGTERTNLQFSVHATVNTEAKLQRVTSLLEKEEGAGIIYTASVKTADEVHDWLKERGVAVGCYHGRMPAGQRAEAQGRFMDGTYRVMLATKAFGLGIDKADIRFVYHYEFPDSLETYYQEAGRAGRDGLPSRAVLLYRLEDRRIQSYFLAGRYPKLAEMEAVWNAVAGRRTERATEDEAGISAAEEKKALRQGALHHEAAGVVVGPAARPHEAKEQAPAAGKAAKVPEPGSIAGLAEAAGVGQRRTEVIVHLLLEAGVILHGEGGYALAEGEPPSAETMVGLLDAYVARGKGDRERLAEMMRYAETSECRVQVIRTYFGEDEGEPCGRCDNCVARERGESPLGLRPQAVAERETDREAVIGHGPVRRIAAAEAEGIEQAQRTAGAHNGQAVTRVETMHGTIVTTSPETLPEEFRAGAETGSRLQEGDAVRHTKFGAGTVTQTEADVAVVQFGKGREKRVRMSFLRRA